MSMQDGEIYSGYVLPDGNYAVGLACFQCGAPALQDVTALCQGIPRLICRSCAELTVREQQWLVYINREIAGEEAPVEDSRPGLDNAYCQIPGAG